MNWTELLFEAVEIDAVELVREFISQGADVHARVDGYDILSAAVLALPKQGVDLEIINLLLGAKANPNGHSEDGKTALYWAAFKDENKLVRLLLNAGATVEAEQPKDGYTSVHIAAEHGNREIMELLLSAGGESALNKFDEVSRTPLMWAVEKGHLEIARMLIEAGADVNAFDELKIGNTALRQITDVGSYEMIELLVKARADPTIPGWMQITALDMARKRAEEKSRKRSKSEDLKILSLLEETAKKYQDLRKGHNN